MKYELRYTEKGTSIGLEEVVDTDDLDRLMLSSQIGIFGETRDISIRDYKTGVIKAFRDIRTKKWVKAAKARKAWDERNEP